MYRIGPFQEKIIKGHKKIDVGDMGDVGDLKEKKLKG